MNDIKIFEKDGSHYVCIPVILDIYLSDDDDLQTIKSKISENYIMSIIDDMAHMGRTELGEMVLNNLDISKIIRE